MYNRKLIEEFRRYHPNDGTVFQFTPSRRSGGTWECFDKEVFLASIKHYGEGDYSIQLRDDFDSYSFLPAIKHAFQKYVVARAANVDLQQAITAR